MNTAHGITRIGPVQVSGKHISDAANEPSEADFIAADLAEDIGKAERRFGVSYRCAVEDQVLNVDAFRRAGWI